MTTAAHRGVRLAVFAGALLLAAWAHRATFMEPYRVNNDALQHVYWMQQFERPELFADDLLTLYAQNYQPGGFFALYRLLARAGLEPLLVSRALPLLLFALSAWLLYRLVEHFAGLYPALLAAALFAASPFFLQKMAGGNPRAFFTPLLLATLWLLVRRPPLGTSPGWVAAFLLPALLLLAAALLYPMAFVLCGATLGLGVATPVAVALWRRQSLRPFLPGLLGLCLGFLLGGSVLVAEHGVPRDPRLGPTISGEQLRASRVAYAGGRANHLPTPSVPGVFVESLRRALPNPVAAVFPRAPRHLPLWAFAGVAVGLVAFLALVLSRRLKPPAALLSLLLASLALYLLADWLLFLLFLPRRYVMYSLPLLAVIALALAAAWGIHWLGRRLPATGRRLLQGLVLAGVLLTARGLDGVGLDDYSEYGALYEYLATLPADALIAAPPYAADGVPYFAGRKVLVTYELSNPYFTTFWQQVRRRLDDFFAAYYAADLGPMAELARHYDVDYVVIDAEDFHPENLEGRRSGRPYFEPFGTAIRRQVAGREHFALAELPAESLLWTSADGRFRVVSAEDL